MDLTLDIILWILIGLMGIFSIYAMLSVIFGIGSLIYDNWLESRIERKEKRMRLKHLHTLEKMLKEEERPW